VVDHPYEIGGRSTGWALVPMIKHVTTKMKAQPRFKSRAVVRVVEPGTTAICASCGNAVKFAARAQHRQVIANVYVKGTWNRVEHFHAECYVDAEEPYGPAAA
jgi:hypothetical protein